MYRWVIVTKCHNCFVFSISIFIQLKIIYNLFYIIFYDIFAEK